ncbi:MAG: autotransporter assembly complex protein TamA [Alphaproteobacteria bacterium]
MKARFQNQSLTFFLMCLSAVLLSACLPFFGQKTDYRFSGFNGVDTGMEVYLSEILKDRLMDDIEEETGSEEFTRATAYREYMIARDLETALRARGYYDASVEFVADEDRPLAGEFQIDSGAQYKIQSVTLEPAEIYQDYFDFSAINAGDPLDAETVLKTQAAMKDILGKDGCYFNLAIRHEVLLDQNAKTADLTFFIEKGAEANFGSVSFEGLESIKEAYIRKLLPWKEGDCFRRERIERFKTTLLESGLFSRAESVLPDAPDEDGRVDVVMSIRERAHRSIKGGLSYYTDEGVGLTLGWEHRNFLGQAEKLVTTLSVNQLKQSLGAEFSKPFFWRPDQTLFLNSSIRRQDTDAFEELGINFGGRISRKVTRRLTVSVGSNLALTQIEDSREKRTFGLVSFPVSAVFDNRDNSLDPTKGWLINATVRPVIDAFGESDPFTKIEGGARTYLTPTGSKNFVVALRADAGSIIGESRFDLPATERFYAGGGGSVRGYGFQEVGPFENGESAGGLSFATGSLELRNRFTETMGGVMFVDAGSVSDDTFPDFNNLAIGAGLGVRYFTGFGPLRFDVAVPLTEKDNLDRNYQFYLSIGQAF